MNRQGPVKNLRQLKKQSETVAVLLKQVSHPQRLLILCSLAEREMSVGEIEEACGASQSAVSQFLKVMRLEGLVDARRGGKQVFYRVADERVLELMKSLYRIFCD